MRKGESQRVLALLTELGLGDDLHFVDASDAFLTALGGLVEPEAKRRAIGDTFVAVFDDEARRLGFEDHLLGQGTIYPDTIETGGTKRADTIKTHHNRVPLIEQLLAEGKVVEPLADLYKVEVREMGARLGVPHGALWRHPFPGPGLGVRLLCSDGADQSEIEALRQPATQIATRFGLRAQPLPIRSVGVKADIRCYEHPLLLEGDRPWEELLRAASELAAHIHGVNRCVWWLGEASASEPEPRTGGVTRARLDLLREADAIMMEALEEAGIYDDVWQCPTVMVPLSFGAGDELVILRPVLSDRAMTARPAQLPRDLLARVAAAIGALPGVSGVALDLTSKPPGTIEWE